jgi:hypothetical protein
MRHRGKHSRRRPLQGRRRLLPAHDRVVLLPAACPCGERKPEQKGGRREGGVMRVEKERAGDRKGRGGRAFRERAHTRVGVRDREGAQAFDEAVGAQAVDCDRDQTEKRQRRHRRLTGKRQPFARDRDRDRDRRRVRPGVLWTECGTARAIW